MALSAPVIQMRNEAVALLEQGNGGGAIDVLIEALQLMVTDNARLQLLVKQLKARNHGSSSEKTDKEQLSLLKLLLVDALTEDQITEDEVLSGTAEDPLDEEIRKAKEQREARAEKPPKKRRNAAIRLEGLEVKHTYTSIPDDKKDWVQIGEETITRLRYKPGHYWRELIHVPVLMEPLAVDSSEADDADDAEIQDAALVIDAPASVVASSPARRIINLDDLVAPTLVPGSLAACDTVAHVVIQKFQFHMPLHRQRRAAINDQGLELPVSTLSDWAGYGGEAAMTLMPALVDLVRKSWAVHTDATTIRVFDKKTGGYRGTITCYVGLDADPKKPPNVVYRFTETGKGEETVWKTLANYEGNVIADACNVHDRLFNGLVARATEVGCNSHGLRSFKALQLEDPRLIQPMRLIQRAYRLETLADEKELSFDERTALRQERTRPIFEEQLKPFCARIVVADNFSSPLAASCQYYLSHWDALTAFLSDGRLPLDNNRAESTLRAVRLGENNYLRIGSTAAGHKAAANMSLIATARAYGLNTLDYLTQTYEAVARGTSAKQRRELLPDRVAMRQAAK